MFTSCVLFAVYTLVMETHKNTTCMFKVTAVLLQKNVRKEESSINMKFIQEIIRMFQKKNQTL